MIIVNVIVETSEENISAFKETIATMETARRVLTTKATTEVAQLLRKQKV